MKTVLIILTKNDQSDLSINEAVSASMLLASFGTVIHVLFKDAALSLLCLNHQSDLRLNQFLKPVKKMIDSFEFYDIEHLYVLKSQKAQLRTKESQHKIQCIELNSDFLQQFDHIISW